MDVNIENGYGISACQRTLISRSDLLSFGKSRGDQQSNLLEGYIVASKAILLTHDEAFDNEDRLLYLRSQYLPSTDS